MLRIKHSGSQYLRGVQLVAEQEILSMLRTKGYWFTIVVGPIYFAIALYLILLGFSFLSSTLKDSEISREEISLEMVLGISDFTDVTDLVQNYLWGDPLNFYIVDHTGTLTEKIRHNILTRDLDALFEAWGQHGSVTLDELHHLLTEHSEYGLDPLFSYRRFREVQESDISIETLNAWLGSGQISGYFVLPEDFLSSNENATFVRPKKASLVLSEKLDELRLWFEEVVTAVRQHYVLNEEEIDTEKQEHLLKTINVNVQRVTLDPSSTGAVTATDKDVQHTSVPLASWIKLTTIPYVYFLIVVLGQSANSVVTSTVEEKSSKVAEMLVATLVPSQVMDGKLLGNATVMFIGIGLVGLILGPPVVLLLGTLFGFDSNAFITVLHPSKVLTWLLFLTLGFAFFGYIQGALGALCNDMKDTIMTLYPVAMIQFFGIMPAVIFVMFAPESKVAQVLSFIPFLTAGVMVGRSASLPNWPVYLLIVLVMCLSVVLVRKFAATIFAHGMASERAPKGLRSIVRLARRPV